MLENQTAEAQAILESLQAPTYNVYYPEELWSEILPGLWQGGTDDADVVNAANRGVEISGKDFDFVATMYASANPVDWFVQEMRFGFYDHDMSDFDTEDLKDIVRIAHRKWKSGNRVLIRCQAGLNRSGLVMALVLIREGYYAHEAIHLIRSQRGSAALCNSTFEEWLLMLDPEEWRS
ncbi:hypothetical protein M2113_001389 [Aurantimicrobium minutum]|uniref:protein-tyrosine phosphatase family protein n=1 Tax=Aurantimicrobium minutum TaxID=708131 RepID=UPI00247324DA|nr:dual specificity protein phosphatase family protein [Aurantimicrobium minutum]MDH6410403.1 hypothetical protein [Aurantimicrobium minutum]